MLKQITKFAVLLLFIVPLASAQQTRVYGDGGNWTQEITGSLAMVKNLKVKVDIGSVRVEGGSQQSINYVIRNHSYSGSETGPGTNLIPTRSALTCTETRLGLWAIGRVAGRTSSPATLWSTSHGRWMKS